MTVAELENSGSVTESIRQKAKNAGQEAVDSLQMIKDIYGENSDEAIREARRTSIEQFNIAKEYYNSMMGLYEQDLDDYIAIQQLKAENSGDTYGVAEAGVKGELYQLELQRRVLMQAANWRWTRR